MESKQREGYVRQLMQIPDALRVVAIIGVGYPAKEPAPKLLYPLETVFHREQYAKRDV